LGDEALSCSGLRFAYGAEEVLRGVELELPAGGFCGLLGPNGSGKSTLLALAAGVLAPASGRIEVLGRPLAAWGRRELARRVAVVPQRFELAFPFTALEVVLLGRLPHQDALGLDGPEDLRLAREAMAATETSHLEARRMHELSGGEWKRVLVAKALAQSPRLLLLDEPAAGLDIRHQVALYELVERIRRERGVTVLAAMHELNLAAAYCDQFVLLKDGRVAASGGLEAVMTYQHLTATFGIDIYVGINELTGHRLFTPMVARGGDKP
jgi:iron complex transport system ATP-binding protein